MRFLATTVLILVAVPAAALASAAGSTPPKDQLDEFVCTHSANAYQRGISVRAVMRAQSYPTHLSLRFELLYKAKGSAATSLKGGDLGKWRHPTHPATLGQRPTDVWRVIKPVSNLTGKGTYRFRVTFRWTPVQSGQRVTTTTLLSPKCAQPHG